MSSNVDFMVLYTAHYTRLWRFILSMVPKRQDAEDLMQETSVVLLQKFSTYRQEGSFFAWAAQIAYYKILNLRRATGRVITLDERAMTLLAQEAAADEGLESDLSDGSVSAALETCLQSLHPLDRQLILRRYSGTANGDALAAEFNRSKNSISKSLDRIRRTLLNCLQRKLSCRRELV